MFVISAIKYIPDMQIAKHLQEMTYNLQEHNFLKIMLLIVDQDVILYIHFPLLAQYHWANSHNMLNINKSNNINFYILYIFLFF